MKLLINIKEINPDNIVSFGAGELGVEFAKVAQEHGVKIKYFCDNDPSRWGTFLDGVEIQSLDYVLEKVDDPSFVLSNGRYKEEILLQLEETGIQEYFYSFYELDFFKYGNLQKSNSINYHNDINQKYATLGSDFLYVDRISFSITTRCSLNCKNCSIFVPYYEKQCDFTKESIFSRIDKLVETFDLINLISIIGGEPLLHPDLFEIVDYISQKKKINHIFIVTNGTILPNKNELINLNKDKVHFECSNYGILSKKEEELLLLLEETGVAVVNRNKNIGTSWFEMLPNIYHGYSEEKLQQSFDRCISRNCTSIVNGKLSRCVVGAYLEELKTLPPEVYEYVDLFDDSMTLEERKKACNYLLYKKTPLKVCNYCNVA